MTSFSAQSESFAEPEEPVPSLDQLRWMLRHDRFTAEPLGAVATDKSAGSAPVRATSSTANVRLWAGLLILTAAGAGGFQFFRSAPPRAATARVAPVPPSLAAHAAAKPAIGTPAQLPARVQSKTAAIPRSPAASRASIQVAVRPLPKPWTDEPLAALLRSTDAMPLLHPAQEAPAEAPAASSAYGEPGSTISAAVRAGKRVAVPMPSAHRGEAQVSRRRHRPHAHRIWHASLWPPQAGDPPPSDKGVSYYYLRGSARSF
jgi:hypothetical protein